MLNFIRRKPEQKTVGQLMGELNELVQKIKENSSLDKSVLLKEEELILKELKAHIK